MNPIFQTENFHVRRLKSADFEAFHEMQGNERVMRFVRGAPMSVKEDVMELKKLIASYDNDDNDFWIFAVERKEDETFVGTVALVKSDTHGNTMPEDVLVLNIKSDQCEIGYRLLERYWGRGYAKEIAKGLVKYAKTLGFKRLIACVADENTASLKILESLNFQFEKRFIAKDLQIPEQKFILEL